MSLTAPLILIVTSIFLLALNRPKIGFLALIFSTLMLLFVGNGIAPRIALAGLQIHPYVVKPEWKKQNLIVLLGAGTVRWRQEPADIIAFPAWAYSRIFEAARLYFECKKQTDNCTILTSGGDPKKNEKPEAEVMALALKKLGVPGTDLILEAGSRNTFQNARFSSPLIRGGSFDQVYLVTSGFHLRRALLYFSYFGIQANAAPSDHLKTIAAVLPLSLNFIFFDVALHEYAGILQFYFYNYMGWNPPPDSH